MIFGVQVGLLIFGMSMFNNVMRCMLVSHDGTQMTLAISMFKNIVLLHTKK